METRSILRSHVVPPPRGLNPPPPNQRTGCAKKYPFGEGDRISVMSRTKGGNSGMGHRDNNPMSKLVVAPDSCCLLCHPCSAHNLFAPQNRRVIAKARLNLRLCRKTQKKPKFFACRPGFFSWFRNLFLIVEIPIKYNRMDAKEGGW